MKENGATDHTPTPPISRNFCYHLRMKRLLPVLIVFGVFIIFSKPIISADLHRVQTPPAQNKEPEKMIEDGIRMILNALQLVLKSLPQYKAPEVLGNGDIIIRRVQPPTIAPDVVNKSKKGI